MSSSILSKVIFNLVWNRLWGIILSYYEMNSQKLFWVAYDILFTLYEIYFGNLLLLKLRSPEKISSTVFPNSNTVILYFQNSHNSSAAFLMLMQCIQLKGLKLFLQLSICRKEAYS